MTVVAVCGPEKAGKTTLIRELMGRYPGSRYRHYDRTVQHEVLEALLAEANADAGLVFWDRCWACECVYAHLMAQLPGGDTRPFQRDDLRDPRDWFLAEWTLGRALYLRGQAVVLLGPDDPDELRRARTPDDLPVDPADEQAAYHRYAVDLNLPALRGRDKLLERAVRLVDMTLERSARTDGRLVSPDYTGYSDSPYVVLGEARSVSDNRLNSLPFTSRTTTMLGRDYPGLMYAMATNIDVANPELFGGGVILAFGGKAHRWCREQGLSATELPHPSWVYRWGSGQGRYFGWEHDVLQRASDELVVSHGVTMERWLDEPRGSRSLDGYKAVRETPGERVQRWMDPVRGAKARR